MAAIVAIVVVGTKAYGCREIIEQTIGEVHLCAIDILFALHLGVELLGRNHRSIAASSIRQTLGQRGDRVAQHDIEHRYALVVLHKAARAHDANHCREGPTVMLVGSKEGRHHGCRGLAFVGVAIKLDVAVLPRFLEVERQLPALVTPGQTSGVGEGCIDVERGTTCKHAVKSNVIVGVGHQTTGLHLQAQHRQSDK